MDEEQREHNDKPCPVGNRWGPEIARLNSELSAVRNRMNAYELAQAMHNRDIMENTAAIRAMSTHETRIDRIEQRSLSATESQTLASTKIASWGTAAGVGVMLFLWIADKVIAAVWK